jgi:glutamyl-tRNA reductase
MTDSAIVLVGLSHRTAPLPVRERAALTDAGARSVLRRLAEEPAVEEALVLSTCNRTELVVVASSPAAGEVALREALVRETAVDATALACAGYARFELDAVAHLFRVAAGLDSAILGETEVTAQLRAAIARAEEERALGPVLRAACRHAVAAARRARSRTGIARGATSTAQVAARLAAAAPGPILLVGAGRMIGSVAAALAGRELMFANRTLSAVRPLAERHGGECAALEAIEPLLARAAAIVSATDAPHPVLTADRLAARRGPLTIVDLAVPRDVEPRAGELPGVRLYDVDAVQARVDEGWALRRAHAEQAEALVASEVRRFADWRRERRIEPLLRELWRSAERVRRAEVDRLGDGLDAADRERLDAATSAFVRRLLDGPARRLRERGGEQELALLLEVLTADERPALQRVA